MVIYSIIKTCKFVDGPEETSIHQSFEDINMAVEALAKLTYDGAVISNDGFSAVLKLDYCAVTFDIDENNLVMMENRKPAKEYK